MNTKKLLSQIFSFLADLVGGAEKSILDFLGALVPYCVPIIPAYLTYYHVQNEMQFPPWVAFTAAFVVETLGMASVSTAIRFYYHNKRYSRDENKAPFELAIGVYVFYIIVVVIVNVILEIVTGTRAGWIIVAIALFTLLSVPSGVLIAIRAQYSEVLDDIQKKYHNNKPQPITQQPMPAGTYSQKHASDYRDKIVEMLEAEYSKSGQVLTPKQITTRLKLSHNNNKGFVSTLTRNWRSDKGF